MVEVAPSMTIVDLSIRGLSPGTYHATVREAGDISEGPESTGGIWEALKAKNEGKPCRGIFGTVDVGKGGVGSVFLDRPVQIWEMIGRSIVVARQQDGKVGRSSSVTAGCYRLHNSVRQKRSRHVGRCYRAKCWRMGQ